MARDTAHRRRRRYQQIHDQQQKELADFTFYGGIACCLVILALYFILGPGIVWPEFAAPHPYLGD